MIMTKITIQLSKKTMKSYNIIKITNREVVNGGSNTNSNSGSRRRRRSTLHPNQRTITHRINPYPLSFFFFFMCGVVVDPSIIMDTNNNNNNGTTRSSLTVKPRTTSTHTLDVPQPLSEKMIHLGGKCNKPKKNIVRWQITKKKERKKNRKQAKKKTEVHQEDNNPTETKRNHHPNPNNVIVSDVGKSMMQNDA